MLKKNKGKITYTLQAISIIPLFFFAIAILLLSYNRFSITMNAEVEQELRNSAKNLQTMFDLVYPGDYHLEGEDAYRLYKGNADITESYSIVDSLKINTDIDATLFFQDTRILTTIRDNSGERIVGSGAPGKVMNEVFQTGNSKFYLKTQINNTEYFSYYMPLYNSDGTIVGMIFVGRSSKSVNNAIQNAVLPLLMIVIIVMFIIGLCLFIYTRRFAAVFIKLDKFLAEVASGNLDAELDPTVVNRRDELGDIGNSAVKMQRSLRHMIEQDALTELFNRRSANRKLKQLLKRSESNKAPFSICIADIDFFKKVNDTYGHDCGDAVLKHTAAILNEHMKPLGFAARWGGEEFLLVFDNMNMFQAKTSLQALLEKIRESEVVYEEQTVKITMTFGVTDNDTSDINLLIKQADDKLYAGKEAGRNRVVV